MSALSIQWAPMLPLWLIGGLGIAAALLIALAFWRRARGVLWRLGAFAVLLLALANPSIIEEQRDPLSDVVFIVADESTSQDIENRGSQTELAVSHLLTQIGALEDTEVRLIRAGDAAGSRDVEGTRLFAPCARPWPRCRASASPPSSWSATGRSTTCRSRWKASASRRRCTCCSPGGPTRATGA